MTYSSIAFEVFNRQSDANGGIPQWSAILFDIHRKQ